MSSTTGIGGNFSGQVEHDHRELLGDRSVLVSRAIIASGIKNRNISHIGCTLHARLEHQRDLSLAERASARGREGDHGAPTPHPTIEVLIDACDAISEEN